MEEVVEEEEEEVASEGYYSLLQCWPSRPPGTLALFALTVRVHSLVMHHSSPQGLHWSWRIG